LRSDPVWIRRTTAMLTFAQIGRDRLMTIAAPGTFTPTVPRLMSAVLLTGHGDFDRLQYREDVPVPAPGPEEVLIRVAAAGVNNTDITPRIGWYSEAVTSGTGAPNSVTIKNEDASWSGTALSFPRIQGAYCCGYIVAVGKHVDSSRIGQRVLVRNMLRSY